MSYGKVFSGFWDSERIAGLSDRAGLLGLFLLTGEHRNAIGCFRLGIGAITDVPRFGAWGFEGVSKALQELAESGFIMRDMASGWTFITKVFEHEPIKNKLMAINAAKLAFAVPANSQIYSALKQRLEPQLEALSKDLQGAVGWPMRTAIEARSKPLRTQEQEQEQYQQQEQEQEQQQQHRAREAGSSAPLPADAAPSAQAAAPPSPLDARAAEGKRRMEIGERILDILNVDPSKWVGNFSLVSAWLNAGYDPELDIYPVVEACAKRPGFRFKTLSYFTNAIEEAYRTRNTEIPRGMVRTDGAAKPAKRARPKLTPDEIKAQNDALLAKALDRGAIAVTSAPKPPDPRPDPVTDEAPMRRWQAALKEYQRRLHAWESMDPEQRAANPELAPGSRPLLSEFQGVAA